MNQHLPQDLIVLTSPPASGKTYWIAALKKALPTESILVISPLRALADECKEKWQDSIFVMTPEEWIGNPVQAEIIIFDEFHLFYYWGNTFRPLMWEAFFELTMKPRMTFLLTATLSEEMQENIKLYTCQFDRILWINKGNQELKFVPRLYVKAPNLKWIEDLIEIQNTDCVNLIFCRYREEVFQWEKRLKKLGYSVITCVGGQAGEMRGRLAELPRPDFIVSTTVLSHGVNLPQIAKIFFLYPVQNIDFWIQMVARGGRRGERFEVYALENPWGIKWSFWTNLLAILRISLKIRLNQNLRPTWFLKE